MYKKYTKKYKKIIFDCTPLHDFLLHYNYALLRDFTTLKLLLYFYYYIDTVTPRRAIARQSELAGTLSRFNDLFSKAAPRHCPTKGVSWDSVTVQ